MRSRCQLELLLQDPARSWRVCANAVPGGRRLSLHWAEAAAAGEGRGGVRGRGLRLRPTLSGAAPKLLLDKERATPTQAPSRVKPRVKPRDPQSPVILCTPQHFHQLTRKLKQSISVGPNSRISAIFHGFNPKSTQNIWEIRAQTSTHLCTIYSAS